MGVLLGREPPGWWVPVMLPVLPHPVVVVPAAYAAALAAAGVLATRDPHPVAACRRTLHAARQHTARAAVALALTLACTAQPRREAPAVFPACLVCGEPLTSNHICKEPTR